MIAIFENAGMSQAEWVLFLIFVIGFPIENAFSTRFFEKRLESGKISRSFLHVYSMMFLWLSAIVILWIWSTSGRPWSELGLAWEWTLRIQIVWGVCALISGYFLVQWITLSFSARQREAYADAVRGVGGVKMIMAETLSEHRSFKLLGTTAGMTEEIIFRGFLIWAFAQFMPLWAAALASLALFIFMHRYQGLAGMGQVAIAGGIITLLFLVGGSLWPLIALHIAIDVLNAEVYWQGTKPLREAGAK